MKKPCFLTAGALLLAVAASAGEKPKAPSGLIVLPHTKPPAVLYSEASFKRITIVKRDAYAGLVKVLLPGDLCEGTDSSVEEAAASLLELLDSLPPVYDTVAVVNAGWCPFQMLTHRQELRRILASQDPAGPSADEDRDGGASED